MKTTVFIHCLFIILVASNGLALDPYNCSVNMENSAPDILNASGNPQTQFSRGDTVKVRFNMINGGPDGLSATVVLEVRDSAGTTIYDSVGSYVISNWGVGTMTATLQFTIPANAAYGWCSILGAVRDGRNGGWDIVYDTTGPNQSWWTWLTNQFQIIQSHTVTAPNQPSGPTSGYTNTIYNFSTNGGSCNQGHSITEYELNWGDGTAPARSSTGQASHSWQSANSYPITAKAKCSAGVWSNASVSKSITITEQSVPTIAVSTTQLDFGTTETQLTFQVWNSGTGTLSYNFTGASYPDWVVSILPIQGTSTGQSDKKTHTLKINRNNLALGLENISHIIVSSTSATNSPQSIQIQAVEGTLIETRLPHFSPSEHGFHFQNWGSFHWPTPDESRWARCTGMSYAALYYWWLGFPTETPAQWGGGAHPGILNKQRQYIEFLQANQLLRSAFIDKLNYITYIEPVSSSFIAAEYMTIKSVLTLFQQPCPIAVGYPGSSHCLLVWRLCENDTKKELWVYDSSSNTIGDSNLKIELSVDEAGTWTMTPYGYYDRFGVLQPFDVLDLLLAFILHSPAHLKITDPSGIVYQVGAPEVLGTRALLIDTDGDGHDEELIAFADPLEGDYSVEVIPLPEADPNSVLTVESINNGVKTELLNAVKLKDVPSLPIVVRVTVPRIGFSLFLQLASDWLHCNDPLDQACECTNPSADSCATIWSIGEEIRSDLNKDCHVDTEDLIILADSWLDIYQKFAPTDITWVRVDDPGVPGHERFNGYVSKYEITNAQYCSFLNSALSSGDIYVLLGQSFLARGANGSNLGADFVGQNYYSCAAGARIKWTGHSFVVQSCFENHPVSYVSWYGATAFANYYGWRLPTEWEWQAVADFDGSYIYGCGTAIDAGRANYKYSIHPYNTTPVYAFDPFGYGMCDLAGNVAEWTSSITDGFYVSRGGHFASEANKCTVSAWGSSTPNGIGNMLGFRVCR